MRYLRWGSQCRPGMIRGFAHSECDASLRTRASRSLSRGAAFDAPQAVSGSSGWSRHRNRPAFCVEVTPILTCF